MSLFNLNEWHKLVLAKRWMAGKDKLLIQSKLNYWQKLNALLLSEFGPTCNSAELYELLSKRKMAENKY